MTGVEVVPYDPGWPAQFETERRLLLAAAAGVFSSVEHVGSTSVPGLAAKPTIDILAVGADLTAVLARRPDLDAVGYEHRPGAFDDAVHLFFRKMRGGRRVAHLHVVTAASGLADDYRLFRDFLIAQPAVRAGYGDYKGALAATYASQRQAYVEEKQAYVDGLMDDARRWRPASPC